MIMEILSLFFYGSIGAILGLSFPPITRTIIDIVLGQSFLNSIIAYLLLVSLVLLTLSF